MTLENTMDRYTTAEEIAHGITHGLGALLSVAALTIMVAFATLKGTAWHIVGCSIFGGTLVLMYTASTLYHSIPLERAKRVLRVVDHSAIYLLIAGTYTPFLLVNLRGAWGWTLLGLIWSLAIAGVILKVAGSNRFRSVSLAFYLLMGWLVVIAVKPLLQSVELGGLLLLASGGLAYTVGVVFYAWRRLPYNHAIWHLFVLTGSALHFFAVLFYVVPLAA